MKMGKSPNIFWHWSKENVSSAVGFGLWHGMTMTGFDMVSKDLPKGLEKEYLNYNDSIDIYKSQTWF